MQGSAYIVNFDIVSLLREGNAVSGLDSFDRDTLEMMKRGQKRQFRVERRTHPIVLAVVEKDLRGVEVLISLDNIGKRVEKGGTDRGK
jgi:hypothetical protein